MKTIDELCLLIHMPDEITYNICSYDKSMNYQSYYVILSRLLNPDTSSDGLAQLKQQLGEDHDGVRLLTCFLHMALDSYKAYQLLHIDDLVYQATMSCFTRFVNEYYKSAGRYGFDRGFWTVREISLRLFRIEELEYEFLLSENVKTVSIHIPSDCKLTEPAILHSYDCICRFIHTYFPDYEGACFTCHSWLLSPALKKLLPANSNILIFQNLFHIVSCQENDNTFMRWVYDQPYDTPIEDLPEKTTLQRRMKHYLEEGNKVGSAYGILTLD